MSVEMTWPTPVSLDRCSAAPTPAMGPEWMGGYPQPAMAYSGYGMQNWAGFRRLSGLFDGFPLVFPYCGRNLAIRFKFHARQTSVHSPVTFFKPRSENWRKPMTDLMMPKTGSTVCLRKA